MSIELLLLLFGNNYHNPYDDVSHKYYTDNTYFNVRTVP